MDYTRTRWSHSVGTTEEYRANWEKTFQGEKTATTEPTGLLKFVKDNPPDPKNLFQFSEESGVDLATGPDQTAVQITINPDVAWADEEPAQVPFYEAICRCGYLMFSMAPFKTVPTCSECE